jgi:hypothetical protein
MTVAAQETMDSLTFAIDPARLAPGAWCHRAEKTIGEGDVAASYSGDRIGMDQPVRKPFEWRGSLWVCVGMSHRGEIHSAEAYRLVHPQRFNGEPTTYREKTRGGDAARADPNGFYHGMTVKHAGQTLVLSGPPATFLQGQTQQLDLFG